MKVTRRSREASNRLSTDEPSAPAKDNGEPIVPDMSDENLARAIEMFEDEAVAAPEAFVPLASEVAEADVLFASSGPLVSA